MACFNPLLEDRRRRKRESLLAATEKQFARIAAEVARRRKKPLTKAEIGVKTGKVLNKYKVGKHFTLTIEDGRFSWQRKQEEIEEEAALDGIYVIRSSEPAEDLSADDAVRNYKRLADVEQAFRTLKGLELLVRPIHHRVDDRVRAHLFVCLLAYYVQWHLKRVWAPLLFADEHLAEHRVRSRSRCAGRTGCGGLSKESPAPERRGLSAEQLSYSVGGVGHAMPHHMPVW